MKRRDFLATGVLAGGGLLLGPRLALADETCQSPWLPKITGEEEFVYVWTLGIEGLGDGSDKLVTVDVRAGSPTFGRVIHTVSVGGRHEAHHGGFTDDRRHFWCGGLDDSMIFVFDVATDPAAPRLVRVIDDFVEKSGGVVGPHTFYAIPGRMIISGLSNNRDHGGRTALVEYTKDGEYVATYWLPTMDDLQGAELADGAVADGYGYDVRVKPEVNAMLTTSFTGWSNYMMDFGRMLQDPEAMKRFGNTAVIWDFKARRPKKIFHVPGAPLEIRWAWGEGNNYAFTSTALTSKLWLFWLDENGEWQAKAVADIGNPADVPLPVDISISADNRTLFVDSFMDGKVRVYDVSDPFRPRQIYERVIGRQLNMVSQSWDGRRVYFTSSLLSRWDKKGEDHEHFLRAFTWDGRELRPRFEIDFLAEGLGRPHIMRFGSTALYRS